MVYTGVGSEDILHTLAYTDIPSSPLVFDIDSRGGIEFEVVLEDSFGQYQRRLKPTSTIGPYHGVRVLPLGMARSMDRASHGSTFSSRLSAIGS